MTLDQPLHGQARNIPRRRLGPLLSMPVWAVLAALCAAALLFSFGRTVQTVVTQGSERRAQDLHVAKTLGRCNTIAARQARDECRVAAR